MASVLIVYKTAFCPCTAENLFERKRYHLPEIICKMRTFVRRENPSGLTFLIQKYKSMSNEFQFEYYNNKEINAISNFKYMNMTNYIEFGPNIWVHVDLV